MLFFVVKGGLASVSMAGGPAALNALALAGLGTLVGMFSNNALEKFKDVFKVLFASAEDASTAILDRLPAQLRDEVSKVLQSK